MSTADSLMKMAYFIFSILDLTVLFSSFQCVIKSELYCIYIVIKALLRSNIITL
eukprot:m.66445 g.66445  ORF g.66445 m.66445 type:complete len:54 (+) comp35388_c1_seq1:2440-2601(+)